MLFYNVSINPAGLGGAAPADGFIDPRTIEGYRSRVTYTGTVQNPVVVAGNAFFLREIPIQITGNNNAAIVSAVNQKSFQHGFFASITDNRIVLTALPGSENTIPTVTDITAGITTALGFVQPTVSALGALPSNIGNARKKIRANTRWKLALETLQLTSNIGATVIVSTSANVDADVTDLQFILQVPPDYFNYDFAGVKVEGVSAIRHAIAKPMLYSVKKIMQVFDPTAGIGGNDGGYFTEEVTVGALTADSAVALGAVTVTPIII